MTHKHQALAEIFKSYRNLVVVGGNWGDEGKGKIIDAVLAHYDVAVRFSGGANAGHTVFTPDGKKIVSHLIPCGLAQHKICVLGRGEFFNLELFLKELEESKRVLLSQGDNSPQPPLLKRGGASSGLSPIYIDQQAPLWTPYHRWFEVYIEHMRGQAKVGTTNKGIGPLEGLYKLRLAPVVGHLFEKEVLETVLKSLFNVLSPCFDRLASDGLLEKETIPNPEMVLGTLISLADKIKDYVADTSFLLHEMVKEKKRMLFEGAQAAGLDAWWGTYPYVSSGNSVAAGACLGTGLPMQEFEATIMVAKILPTRVGFGPFASEMWERAAAMDFAKDNADLFADNEKRRGFLAEKLQKINSGHASRPEMSQYFQVLGDERGATTGRGRSVGFLDIPWLLYAIRINRPKWLALTRFDMLSKIKSLPVVVAYKYQGKILPPGKLPPPWHLQEVEAVLEHWECWPDDIMGAVQEAKLPAGAKKFLQTLEKHLGVPILLVGTGPGRDDLVVRA